MRPRAGFQSRSIGRGTCASRCSFRRRFSAWWKMGMTSSWRSARTPFCSAPCSRSLQHSGQEAVVLPSLRREEDERAVLLGSLGALYTLGYPIDWSLIYPTGGRCVRSHPTLGKGSVAGSSRRLRDADALPGQGSRSAVGDHPLLGRHFKSPHLVGTHFWESTLDKRSRPYLDDHRIQDVAVLPASAYLEMALAAAGEMFGAQSVTLKEVEFRQALFLREGEPHTIQVVLSPGVDGPASFHIYSGAGASSRPANHGCCMQPARSVSSRTTAASPRMPTARRSMRCGPRSAEGITGQDYYRKTPRKRHPLWRLLSEHRPTMAERRRFAG